MLNKCLVTELKSVVNKDNLDYLDFMLINFSTGSIRLKYSTKTKIVAKEGNFKISGTSYDSYTVNANVVVVLSSVSGCVLKLPKYNLVYFEPSWIGNASTFTSNGIKITSMPYNSGLESLKIKGYVGGKIPSSFKINSVVQFELNGTNISGSLSDIIINSSATSFLLSEEPNITGTLSYFADFNSLTTLDTNYCNLISGVIEDLGQNTSLESLKLGNNNISGSIEEFVKRQVANGRTSCSNLSVSIFRTAIFYNNSRLPTNDSTFYPLEWEPAATAGKTKITFKNVEVIIDNE